MQALINLTLFPIQVLGMAEFELVLSHLTSRFRPAVLQTIRIVRVGVSERRILNHPRIIRFDAKGVGLVLAFS